MSARRIVVTIDANENTCGKCRWRLDCLCRPFDKGLGYWNDMRRAKRCPACLSAEKEAKRG